MAATRPTRPRHGVLRSFLLLGAAVSIGLSARAGACPLTLPTLAVTVAGHPLTAELARTPEAHQCGLSQRDRLAPDHGMLFVFPRPVRIAFWMKDTGVPLSIAFLDDDGRILAISRMTPLDTRQRHRPAVPYRYALEVPQGWFARHGVKKGDPVRFALPE